MNAGKSSSTTCRSELKSGLQVRGKNPRKGWRPGGLVRWPAGASVLDGSHVQGMAGEELTQFLRLQGRLGSWGRISLPIHAFRTLSCALSLWRVCHLPDAAPSWACHHVLRPPWCPSLQLVALDAGGAHLATCPAHGELSKPLPTCSGFPLGPVIR